MEQRFWTLTPILAQLKLQPHFLLGATEEEGTLETHGLNSTETKLPTILHPPVGASRNTYSSRTPSAKGGDEDPSPLITRGTGRIH